VNIYHFDFIRLVLPYSLALSLTFPFVIIGLFALWNNGVPSSAGFMQIVATTRNSVALERFALEASLGGDPNFSNEFRKLKLRYGELNLSNQTTGDHSLLAKDSISASVVAGFGLPHEVFPLVKRKPYGLACDETDPEEGSLEDPS
jgi:hypothetical protein